MNDENDLPWEAKVLRAGPIKIGEDTEATDIAGPIREKLEAVMSLYGCEPTPEGWRKLALSLILDMQEGRRTVVKTPYSRSERKGPGKPSKGDVSSWIWMMNDEITNAERLKKPITAKRAAEIVRKNLVRRRCVDIPSVRRLQNLYAERDDLRHTFQGADFFLMLRAEEAIELAAAHLESQSRK